MFQHLNAPEATHYPATVSISRTPTLVAVVGRGRHETKGPSSSRVDDRVGRTETGTRGRTESEGRPRRDDWNHDSEGTCSDSSPETSWSSRDDENECDSVFCIQNLEDRTSRIVLLKRLH